MRYFSNQPSAADRYFRSKSNNKPVIRKSSDIRKGVELEREALRREVERVLAENRKVMEETDNKIKGRHR